MKPHGYTNVLRIVCASLLLALPSLAALAEPVTVAWDANPVEEQVTGYLLHYGEVSATDAAFSGYDVEVNVGNVTEYTVDLPDATAVYYLAVVAYNGMGLRSDYSAEVTREVASPATYTVAVSAGAGGSVSPSGNVSVTHGGNLTVSIAPNTGYAIANVLVDGTSVGAVTSTTLSNITASHTVSASFVAKTYTVAMSAGAGGSVSPSGNVSVTHGGNLTVSIAPNTGYAIANVLVDGTSVGAVTSTTLSNVTASHTVSASFVAKTYTVAMSAGEGGSVSPSGNVSVTHGGNLTVSIAPNTGYAIADVQVDGASIGAVVSHTLQNVTGSHTVSASFVAKTYTVAVSAGAGGSVTPSGSVSVTNGGNLTVSIAPNTGYAIADVLVDGTSVGAVASATLSNLTASHTVSASFVAKTYTVAMSTGAGGSVSPSGNVSVSHGGNLTVSIAPNTGYAIDDVQVNGASIGAVASHTLQNVTAAHTVTASFIPIAPLPSRPVGLHVIPIATAGL